MKFPPLLLVGATVFGVILSSVQAQNTYIYNGATNGAWSNDANWMPNTGYPGVGGVAGNTDIADINNVTANQIVDYDTGASGFLGTLSITQTSAFVNEVLLQKSLTLTNALVLGASAGTAELATGTTTTSFALSVGTGTISVNSGGLLALGDTASTITASAVTVSSGGTISTLGPGTGTNTGQTISGTLSINTGATFSVVSDSSLTVNGNFTMNGTATNTANIASINGTTGLSLRGATNTIAASNNGVINNIVANFNGGTLSAASPLGAIAFQQYNTGIYTISSSYAGGAQVGNFIVYDETRGSGANTVKLASNLASSGTLSAGNFTLSENGSSGNALVTVDTNSYTLDFSTYGTAALNPGNVVSNSASIPTLWTLTDSTSTTGKVKAPSFTLTTATGGFAVSSTVTLQATGGNSTANNLGSNGVAAFASTATFLYSGAAVAATPATLTSNRSIGNLTVQNGALQLLSAITATGTSVAVNTGGTLDLHGFGLTAASGALTLSDTAGSGGTITNSSGTAVTLSAASMTFNPGGTLAYTLSGSSTSNLLVSLSGALTKGTTGTGMYNINLTGSPTGSVYELAAFTSTTFAATDFNDTGSVPGTFSIVGGDELEFTVTAVPEPSTWTSGLFISVVTAFLLRRRLRLAARCTLG